MTLVAGQGIMATRRFPFGSLTPMKAVSWAFASTRDRGAWRTLQIIGDTIYDLAFDWRHQIETVRWVGTQDLVTASPNAVRAVKHQATRARPFLKLFGRLQLPRDSVFVDFGAGKGRALLLASRYPFKRVIGLEFCRALCAQARENVRLFQQRTGSKSCIEIVEGDAADYELREDENVFYLYNPFDSVVLDRVLQNIRRSVEMNARPIWLIYNTPAHGATVESTPLFTRRQKFVFGGTEFCVYTNDAPSEPRNSQI
jgi:SAM-dependent methyltransferase